MTTFSLNHRIYTGSFAALESRWIELVSEVQKEDPLREIDVLVGSNVLALYLKRRFAESGRTAANIRFYTFPDLLARLTQSHPSSAAKARMPRLGPSVILESLLSEKTPHVYGELSGYQGFRDALLDTFRDLRDGGFAPKDLEKSTRKWKDTDRGLHLLGFADLYRRYRERAALFHDVDDDFRDAIDLASEPTGHTEFRPLFIYGIYDVTGQQSLLFRSLRDSHTLTYFIPFVSGEVSEFSRPFVESRARELGVAPIALRETQPPGNLGKLAHVDFGLSASSHEMEDDGSVALISVPGESRAAIEILREIFRAVQDRTIGGFHEAAVILRQPEVDVPVIAEMLRVRGIPYFVHGGRSFAECPLGRAVIALGRLESVAFAREAVLTAMELVEAALSEDDASRWDVQDWRALTNDPRFLSGLPAWDSGTEALVYEARSELAKAERSSDADADSGEDARARSLRGVQRRLESALRLRDAWQAIRKAATWPTELGWGQWAAELDQRFSPLMNGSRDWQIFSSVLDEIGSLDTLSESNSKNESGRSVPADMLRAALIEAVSSHSCPVGQFQRSGVNLLSTSAARGLRFPLVIIPGLDEGRFPSKLRQDPLLLDAERSSMGSLPVKSRRVDEEKLLFDMAARSAEKRLVLMTSRLDESSDRERIPSQFFLRAASAVRGSTVTMRDLTQGSISGFRSVSLDSPAPGHGEVPVDEGEIRLRIVTSARELSGAAIASLAQLEPSLISRPLKYDQARWANRLTPFDGLITNLQLVQWTAQRLGISAGQVSASRLEEYMKCPYSFFLKRVMDLQGWEEQGKVEAMDPLERGTAIHSVLEEFLRDNGDIGPLDSGNAMWNALEGKARKILDDARPAGLADLLWEVERDVLLRMLKGWLGFEMNRAGSGLQVARLEQIFGEFAGAEKFPAFSIEAGPHAFSFRGRIDRIDLSADRKYARVVDYKTGTLPDSMARKSARTPLMAGEKIQLLIYAGALSVLKEFAEVETVEAEYLHLQPKNGLTVPCSFTHEELKKAAESFPKVLELVGNGIESGVFFAKTSGKVRPQGHCEFCNYLSVCGKDRIRREERKSKDPRVRLFIETVESL